MRYDPLQLTFLHDCHRNDKITIKLKKNCTYTAEKNIFILQSHIFAP